jgi:hypothetical protein
MMLIQHHKASGYSEHAIVQFEQLRHDAQDAARVMAIVLHPYIMGAPLPHAFPKGNRAHLQLGQGALPDGREDRGLVSGRSTNSLPIPLMLNT